MSGPAYPTARVVAPKVQTHFILHMKSEGGTDASPDGLPDAAAIETIIDAAFWASLRQEEKYVPRLSLALVGPRWNRACPSSRDPAALVSTTERTASGEQSPAAKRRADLPPPTQDRSKIET